MTEQKLAAMPYAQACVITDQGGNIFLQSYRTIVAGITAEGWAWCNGTYSQTTRKHIGAFAKQFITYTNGDRGSYYLFKKCFTENISFNIMTGEIKEN